MRFSLFPKNERFFDLLSQSASNMRRGAQKFLAMVNHFTGVEAKANELKEIESAGDSITHQIIDLLNASYITPIDREDISELAGRLDTVLDEIEGVASRMHLFAVDRPTPECVELGRLVAQGAELLEKAITNLKAFSGLSEFLIGVNSIENRVDEITRGMVAKLFHSSNGDILYLIKWKEIYTRLEHTADRMEDVANVIEDIVVKHA